MLFPRHSFIKISLKSEEPDERDGDVQILYMVFEARLDFQQEDPSELSPGFKFGPPL